VRAAVTLAFNLFDSAEEVAMRRRLLCKRRLGPQPARLRRQAIRNEEGEETESWPEMDEDDPAFMGGVPEQKAD
jgi:hypothetical protein